MRRWVIQHPVAWGVVSGFLTIILGIALTWPLVVAVVPGILMGILNWYLWRPRGPARAWADRLSSGQ